MESDFCCFGDLFELFLHFGARENSGPCQNRFFHNDLTRRTDPRHPEGPWIFFYLGSRFCDLHFSEFGPRAQGPWAQGPWAQGPGPRALMGRAERQQFLNPSHHPSQLAPRGRDKPFREPPHWDRTFLYGIFLANWSPEANS